MQAKNKLYHPATIGVDWQSVPGTFFPDRHDGITMLKELLEYLGGPGDSQDIDEHMLYLQTMRANPPPGQRDRGAVRAALRARDREAQHLPAGEQAARRLRALEVLRGTNGDGDYATWADAL